MISAVANNSNEVVRGLVEKAQGLRPLLREKQADTEARGFPCEEIYEAIAEAGLFPILKPKCYGGLELELTTFYRVVVEIARGCPSTGWWYALGAGHAAQIASYFSKQAQDEIFGLRENFQAPWSFVPANVQLEPVEGGYRVSGRWYYASGVPYASHFMGNIQLPKNQAETGEPMLTIVVPQGQFTRLDNWGTLIGMKGSGSHGVQIEDVFVPHHMTFRFDAARGLENTTIGYELHNNPLYNGLFLAFAEGGLAAQATGVALAALDEYEEIIATKNTPGSSTLRARDENFQRCMGMAMAWADSAMAITLQGAELYVKHGADCATGRAEFTVEKALRMDGMYHTAERLAQDVVELMVRTASSAALRDDARLPRYMRDITMCISRGHDQFEFRAARIARKILTRRRGLSF